MFLLVQFKPAVSSMDGDRDVVESLAHHCCLPIVLSLFLREIEITYIGSKPEFIMAWL